MALQNRIESKKTHRAIEKLQARPQEGHRTMISPTGSVWPIDPAVSITGTFSESRVASVSETSAIRLVSIAHDPTQKICDCSCNSPIRIQSSGVFGALLIGYRPHFSTKPPNGKTLCQGHQTRMTCSFAFPSWFWNRAISMTYYNSLNRGPELLFRVVRVRELLTIKKIFGMSRQFAQREVKRMLYTGLASVGDVDEEGDSILNLAMRMCQWGTADMLISYGADLRHENRYSETPIMHAWQQLFEKKDVPAGMVEKWGTIISRDKGPPDAFGFTALHKAYLGLSGVAFGQAIADTDWTDIDRQDSQGRTVLIWAAARGDSTAVSRLLACGADPNLKCAMGKTALHVAAKADRVTAEMLLDAKADANSSDRCWRTPITFVSEENLSLISLMAGKGADINIRSVWGGTPLYMASLLDKARNVAELLACGANIDTRNAKGWTPLRVAICDNSHRALPILLACYRNRSTITDQDRSVLCSAAAYADDQTLHVLRDGLPACILPDTSHEGRSAEEMARFRREANQDWAKDVERPADDDPESWYAAWRDLIDEINDRCARVVEVDEETWVDAREEWDDQLS